MEDLIIGAHVNFNKNEQLVGCVKQALDYKATTFMFYTGAPQNTVRVSIDDNLTVSQAYVIDFIYMEGKEKDIFQKDLEKEFDLKRSSVSLLLNNMEKSDLIQRVPVAEDARLKKIILTEKAMILNENISMAINSVENKLSENITLEEINVFYRVLDKIRNNLE